MAKRYPFPDFFSMTSFVLLSETDLDEVLQSQAIFTNVSKGVLAKKEELSECFRTTEEKKIILEVSFCTHHD